MGHSRLELHNVLKGIADHVYFQPPSGHLMQFPCITYVWDQESTQYADNELYRSAKRYQVTVIDRDPDTELAEQVRQLRYCSFERRFALDDLNHYVFSLFF